MRLRLRHDVIRGGVDDLLGRRRSNGLGEWRVRSDGVVGDSVIPHGVERQLLHLAGHRRGLTRPAWSIDHRSGTRGTCAEQLRHLGSSVIQHPAERHDHRVGMTPTQHAGTFRTTGGKRLEPHGEMFGIDGVPELGDHRASRTFTQPGHRSARYCAACTSVSTMRYWFDARWAKRMLGQQTMIDARPFGVSDGRWHAGIGDPTTMGWVTVLCYATATALAGWAWMSRRRAADLHRDDPAEARNQRMMARFWVLCTVLLAALGVNKQLDLQSWFTQSLRDISVRGGWYDDRRKYQIEFVVGLFVFGVAGTLLLAYWLRHIFRRAAVALAGIGLLLCFVVIRAASYHYVDRLLMVGTIRLNWVFEIGGIALIGFGILSSERQARRSSSTPRVPEAERADAAVGHAPV